MKDKKLMRAIGYVDDKYLDIAEEEKVRKRHKSAWVRWGSVAACFVVAALLSVAVWNICNSTETGAGDNQPEDNLIAKGGEDSEEAVQDVAYVDVQDLIAPSDGIVDEVLRITQFQVGGYNAFYEGIDAVSSEVLDKSCGDNVAGSDNTFYLQGHDDLQYVIRKTEDGTYGLWKFDYFESDEYPYCDVLELIYGIDSVEDIEAVVSVAADMDNTDEGKRIQEEIGTLTVTDTEDIKTLYRIISAMTCYGCDNWDRIDYGANDNDMTESVRQGRYLSIHLTDGRIIDSLKYTGISGMFYEYMGIAYNRLSDADSGEVERILEMD